MLPARRLRDDDQGPIDLQHRALNDIQYIRETMERSGSFTAVSGWAGVAMGLIALAAAFAGSLQTTWDAWLLIWVAAAVVATPVALVGMARKARSAGSSLLNGPGRKFIWSFAPPIGVGLLLSVFFYQAGMVQDMPGLWLLLYGAAVVSGGSHSVKIIPVSGLAFLAVGAFALFAPASWGNALLALGFGGIHLVFGSIIVRRHGG